MLLGEDEKKFLKEYPYTSQMVLERIEDGHVLQGDFTFEAVYNKDNDNYTIHPSDEQKKAENYISDTYNISITFPEIDTYKKNFFIGVREEGGKISDIAIRYNITSMADLHVEPNGTLCLAGEFQKDYTISLKEFIQKTVLQFFYNMSYFDRRNGIWPRENYTHYFVGMLESYHDAVLDGGDPKILLQRLLDRGFTKQRLEGLSLQRKQHPLFSGAWRMDYYYPVVSNDARLPLMNQRAIKGLHLLLDAVESM